MWSHRSGDSGRWQNQIPIGRASQTSASLTYFGVQNKTRTLGTWPLLWYLFLRAFVVVQLLSHVQLCETLQDFHQYSSVQSLSRVWLFATPWTAVPQASLSITSSPSLLKLMSIELVMPFNHLILCCPLRLPNLSQNQGFFQNSHVLPSGGQRIGSSASASVLPMNIQDWSPLGWTGWISLQFKGLSRVFSNITVQKHQFFGAQLSLQSNSHIHTWLLEKP